MEARRDSLSSIKLCRFCLAQGDTLTSIYEKRSTKNTVSLPLKILSCVSIEVFPSDKKPTYICSRCKFFIEMSYDFKHICRQADEHILQFIQNATPLAPTSWPQPLVKLFRLAHKAPDVPLVKTVIEGGATVHVSAQESDTDEEDNENVYNVKIGDGSDDGSKSARIKVVNAADKQEKGKAKRNKGFTSPAKLVKHTQAHTDDRSFPCKYCSKSFVKSQHYTRHLRLKHRETIRTCRGPFGESDQYRCEQCEDTFATQDELIYHSAIHATQNLTCPLCQEKFEDVDAVTSHIKSHVNGTEFMCELCELVYTTKEKLDFHMSVAHEDEAPPSSVSLPNLLEEESSNEMDVAEDEEDSSINIKELDDHLMVEINKTSDYLIPEEESQEKPDLTQSEESDVEMGLPDLATAVATMSCKTIGKENAEVSIATIGGATITKTVAAPKKDDKIDSQTASILRKAEEIKKIAVPQVASEPIAEKKTLIKAENNLAGTSDKSLRMLEKDLQELKRTHPRNEAAKTQAKPVDALRNRRTQIHTSTPKPRTPTDDRKMIITSKSPVPDKKLPERRVVTKENKEPKETKDVKANNGNGKEEKEIKEKQVKEKELKDKEPKEKELKEKEVKQKEVKEKETPKSVVKNGNDRSNSEDGVRRSTRPSKIKDYAKMIRDRSQDSDEENDDSDDGDDDEYKEELEKVIEPKARPRRASTKTTAPKATPSPSTPATRKRGRPRKDVIPPKIRKEEIEDEDDDDSGSEKEKPKTPAAVAKELHNEETTESNKSDSSGPLGTIVSPTGQTLKKIPCNALPPGVKATPLPRPGLCEMQIGQKVVKVQKIIMTKAEVQAMQKQGLLHLQDGNMILKSGIKLPQSGVHTFRKSLAEDKESPNKAAAPSRCELEED